MEVVFDVRSAAFASWFAFVPLGVLVAALLIELFRRRGEIRDFFASPRNPRIAIYLLACVVLVLLTGAQLLGYVEEKKELIRVLDTDQARIVEGEITNYTPQAWTGRPLERFQVGSERFSFDGFGASPAYHKRARDGGRLREGMHVRLFEFRGTILRIEALESGRATTPD